jgi:homoserine kinase
MLAAGALGALLSGSGPTLFALARDLEHARTVARVVEDDFSRIEVVESRQACVEISAPEETALLP